jgi:hypothetical protein
MRYDVGPTLPSQPVVRDAVEDAPSTLDFALRLAFFGVAPFGVALLSSLFPLLGAVINVGIFVAFFVLAPTLRPVIARRRWLNVVLGAQLRFDAYYRTRAPRPFVYYVFYPLLLPYWIANADARREFLLFKGYTAVSLVVLLVTSLFSFFLKWRPELGFVAFAGSIAYVLVIEALVVLSALMPIATTVVRYHVAASHKRLYALLAVGCVSASIAITGFVLKRHEIVPVPTATRMYLRGAADPARSYAAREAALRAAVAALTLSVGAAPAPEIYKDPGRIVDVLGRPLDVARAQLARFYKEDETRCFHLVEMLASDRTRVVVLYGDDGRTKASATVWLGYRAKTNTIFDDRAELPTHALGLLSREARR